MPENKCFIISKVIICNNTTIYQQKIIFPGLCYSMKIYSGIPVVQPLKKQQLKEHIRNFDKLISNRPHANVQKIRNMFGLPIHFAATIKMLYDCFWEGCEPVSSLLVAKVNYDFVQYIRNINKRKSALLSGYLKEKGVDNPEDIKWAVKRYFTQLGPVTHPKGIKQIVEKSTYPRSFETGIFAARSDKKSILYRFLSYL